MNLEVQIEIFILSVFIVLVKLQSRLLILIFFWFSEAYSSVKDTLKICFWYLAGRGMNISVSSFMDDMQKNPDGAKWHLHYGDYNNAFL